MIGNPKVLRMLRILKICRVLRFFTAFKDLYLLGNGIYATLKPLFWVSILLFLILYMIGLMCTMELSTGDGAQGLTVDQNWEVMDEYHSQMYWGSIPRSMFTLFNFILLAECS